MLKALMKRQIKLHINAIAGEKMSMNNLALLRMGTAHINMYTTTAIEIMSEYPLKSLPALIDTPSITS